MGLVSQTAPAIFNGVSQQEAHLRNPSQCEAQENILSDVAHGIMPRPPTEHTKLLTGSAAGGSPVQGFFHHVIDRGDGQQFEVLIEDGDINVYDLSDGSEVTVNDVDAAGTPGAYTYLDIGSAQARDSFEAVTIADYTFILNKTKNTALGATLGADRANAHEFLFVANSSFFNVNGKLIIAGTTIQSAAAGVATVVGAMNNFCSHLTGLQRPNDTAGTVAGSTNWKFTRVSDHVLHGYQFQNAIETIDADDTLGGDAHIFIATGTSGEHPTVSRFSDLPNEATDGFVALVKGDDGSIDGEFFVKYVTEEQTWKETVAPALQNTFDVDTMPHALIYDAVAGDFDFSPLNWDRRTVGDTDSAPDPSFIGNPIKDVVIHKNRLMLISEENVVGGEAGEFFNLWPTTVTTILDSDPFDVSGTGSRVANWDFAVPFRGNLTLFSNVGDTVGELVGGRDSGLTSANARIEERGSYPVSAVRPASAGDSIYYVLERGASSELFRYQENDIELYTSDSISQHLKDYLPNSIFKIAVGRAENLIVLLSDAAGEQNRMYVYRYHFEGNQQIMSSWSRWSIDDDAVILNADWIDSILYLTIERQDGIHFEKIDFGKTNEDEGLAILAELNYRVYLDSLMLLTGVYAAGPDETTWTIPFDQATNGGTWHIIKQGGGAAAGTEVTVKSAATDGQITASGDWSAAPKWIGREYLKSWEPSEQVLRSSNSSTATSQRLNGRLQLRTGLISYRNTGTFDVKVLSRQDTDEFSDTFTSSFDGATDHTLSGMESGDFRFAVGGNSQDVRIVFESTSHFPFNFTAFSWEGTFFQRSKQI